MVHQCSNHRASLTLRPPRPAYYRTRIILAIALMLLCSATAAFPEANEPYRVLVLHSFRNSLPVNTGWYKGLVRGFATVPGAEVWIDTETLDLARVRDASYLNKLGQIFRHKYRNPRPQLIIPTYTPALRFLLDYGEELFPGVPILFLGPDSQFVATRKLPPHISGITSILDIAGTLELALRVHPATRRVAVIVGTGPVDEEVEHRARQALQPFEARVEFLWLKGMPDDELAAVVRQLPRDSVILYLLELQDRTGKSYVPVSTLQGLSLAANAPIYGLWDTLLGHGVVGGRMITIENDGFLAARMALRILKGEAPAAVPIVKRRQNAAIFNDRELARWGVDADRLPAGSQVLYRQPSLWDEYRTWIIGTVLLIGVQGLWILALLLNRSRLQRIQTSLREENKLRLTAEMASMKQRRRLEKFSKERSLGVMATAIAHEINQPLIAVQNYVLAAKHRLRSDVDATRKLDALLNKAEQQAGRAGDIIQRIRNLVTSDTPEMHPASLHSIIAQAVFILESEIESRGCEVEWQPAAELPPVLADDLQIQLVVVNLLRNAMHSVKAAEDKADRIIHIEARRMGDREIQVDVVDHGPGIPPDRAADLFEPFASDKGDSMGMGLAICQLIIEAHGGRIWHQPNPSGGAILSFTLCVARDKLG
jgi:signal transduction histidine kinase